ncbi:MAG: sugar transferase [Planctomycetes bacterium]|nr:sugar transferase [Planctomycetota bacterium]
MLQAHHRTFTGTIRLADAALLIAACWVTNRFLSGAFVSVSDAGLLVQSCLVLVCWFVLGERLDLYQSRRTENLFRELQSLGEAVVLCMGLVTILALALHRGVAFHPVTASLLGFAAIAFERTAVRGLLRSLRVRGYNFRYAVIVGCGRSGEVLAATLRGHPQYGVRLLGGLRLPGENGSLPAGVRDLTDVGNLRSILSEFAVDQVLLCPSHEAKSGNLLEVFNLCDLAGTPCHYAPSFFSLRGVHPSVAWYGNLPAFAFSTGDGSPLRRMVKRSIDFFAALIGIVILSPVLITIAVVIKLTDRGPVLFRQTRVGQFGRPFACLKFRSMCMNAEAKLAELRAANEEDGPTFKMKDDPRVTKIGRLLRKYSLDELPQLFNVLLGDMSLVGPRPPIPSEVEEYDWWQRRRLSVRPGITCIWQVFGRNRVPFERWMEMDLQYIDNWSLTMDMKLLARTVGTVVKGTGC